MTERAIYRSRQPLVIQGQVGFADVWCQTQGRAEQEASRAPDRFVERLTWVDVLALKPAAQLKARAAWVNAFPDDADRVLDLPGVTEDHLLEWLQTRYG